MGADKREEANGEWYCGRERKRNGEWGAGGGAEGDESRFYVPSLLSFDESSLTYLSLAWSEKVDGFPAQAKDLWEMRGLEG